MIITAGGLELKVSSRAARHGKLHGHASVETIVPASSERFCAREARECTVRIVSRMLWHETRWRLPMVGMVVVAAFDGHF